MYHFLYKTTNLINKKIYIGKHSTENLGDGYLGSGLNLWRAIEKYGVEHFSVEIISFHCSSDEAFKEEAIIVNDDFVSRKDTYNIAVGGNGCNLVHPDCLSGENHYLYKYMGPVEREVHADKYKRGDNYWISKGINPEDKLAWIDKNWTGENHSHKKCYTSEEKYQQFLNKKFRGKNFWLNRCLTAEERDKYIEENYVGMNNPIFRNKNNEEIEDWLNKYRRGENAPNAKYIYEFEIDEEKVFTSCLNTFCQENGYNLHILRKIIERDSGKRSNYKPRDKRYKNWKGKRHLK